MLVFALMGVGPLLPWRRAEGQTLRRNLLWMLGAVRPSPPGPGARHAQDLPLHHHRPGGMEPRELGLLLAGAIVPRARITGRSFGEVFTSLRVREQAALRLHGRAPRRGRDRDRHRRRLRRYRVDQQLRLEYGAPTPSRATSSSRGAFAEREGGRLSVGVYVDVFENGERSRRSTPASTRFGDRR
jgi:hypothetical protein